MDPSSGIGILGLALLIVVLGLAAVERDILTGVPAERITMIGGSESPIPWQTLLTGMIFIQQNLTQRCWPRWSRYC
jgi:SSS family solute:Na+ symporter